MWEIGMPDFKDFSIKWKQRAVLTLPKTDTICLVVNSELEVLIVGCENSCYGWKLEKLYKNEKNLNVVPDFEFVHPKLDDDDEPVVIDGLALLSNNCIVTKCVDENRLYLWDLEPHTDGGFKGPKPYRILVSPMAELQYINTAVDYLYLHTCKDILSVGDDKGNIYMYNLKSVVSKKKNCDEVLLPSLTLEYPDLNIDTNYEESMKDVTEKKDVVINCLGQSSDGEYMVCGTDNNLLCIWQACS
ncbi:leucine-rich repeat and WD repeat-containing protein 1-like [Ruditapes philippinarum]|uniref:leucine-rich repeat and WD repeat-containing protein 1-like n=1 Tax=Ruditapes philippinarum TaxID=129788 RepID=UPI00295B6C87|nr:leucine-rich repeat and WD repeat-containing protein 1-like [Ruditapes philippinarum]